MIPLYLYVCLCMYVRTSIWITAISTCVDNSWEQLLPINRTRHQTKPIKTIIFAQHSPTCREAVYYKCQYICIFMLICAPLYYFYGLNTSIAVLMKYPYNFLRSNTRLVTVERGGRQLEWLRASVMLINNGQLIAKQSIIRTMEALSWRRSGVFQLSAQFPCVILFTVISLLFL